MFTLAGDTPEEAASEAAAVYAIEESLAKAQMPAVDRRDPVKIYHKRRSSRFRPRCRISTSRLISRTLRLRCHPSTSSPPWSSCPRSTSRSSRARWRRSRATCAGGSSCSSANKTTPELEQANFDFFGTTVNGTPQMLPQWRRCVGWADARLGEALGQEYVKIAFPPESKAKAVELMTGIRTALKQDISSLDWMARTSPSSRPSPSSTP